MGGPTAVVVCSGGPSDRGLPGGIMPGEPGDPGIIPGEEPAASRGTMFMGAPVGPAGRPTPLPPAPLRGDIFCLDLGLGWLGKLPLLPLYPILAVV